MNYLIYPLILVLTWVTEPIHLAGEGYKCYPLSSDESVYIHVQVLENYEAKIYYMDGDKSFGHDKVQTYDKVHQVDVKENQKFCIWNYYLLTPIDAKVSITNTAVDYIVLLFILGFLCGCCICLYNKFRNCKCPSGPNITFVQAPQAPGPTVQTPSTTIEMEELPKKSKKSKGYEYV